MSTQPPPSIEPRNWFARSLGLSDEQRRAVVDEAQKGVRRRTAATAYWLQLFLAMGIATLGLVLDSTGVVIGAMLVAPLMGPIVQLALGLVVSSPRLVLYSLSRVGSSIVFVVLSAALITGLLPFHEVTKEILARTSPTALDLGVAAFCALAGGFATVRSGADTAVTAAGTSIGISLVPPLCVVGFGVGVQRYELARGAALLFVANLSAILFFCALFFVVLGFARVNTVGDDDHSLLASARRGVGRLLLPLVLIAVVFVPLRSALRDVTAEVSHRRAVQRVIDALVQPADVVRAQLDISPAHIQVKLVIVDHDDRSDRVRIELQRQVQQQTGVRPTVEVVAVPDALALRALATRDLAPPEPRRPLSAARAQLAQELERQWPTQQAGAIVRWTAEDSSRDGLVIRVVHEGLAMDAAAEALLSRSLSEALHDPVTVRSLGPLRLFGRTTSAAELREQIAPWVALALREGAWVCVRTPVMVLQDAGRGDASRDASMGASLALDRAMIEALLAPLDAERRSITEGSGPAWLAGLQLAPCAPSDAAQPDASAPDAGVSD